MDQFIDSEFGSIDSVDVTEGLFYQGNNSEFGMLMDEDDDYDEDEHAGEDDTAGLKFMSQEAIEVFNEFSFGPKEKLDDWLSDLENNSTKIVNAKSNEDRSFQKNHYVKTKSKYDDTRNDYMSYIYLIKSVISNSFSDAKPFSVIMSVSNSGSSATPDLESVYDAHMFFKSKRVGYWTGLVGADPSPVIRKFNAFIKDWDKGVNFGRSVIAAAIVSLDGDEEFISTSTAVEFIFNDRLFNFWCGVAAICPEKVKKHFNLSSRVSAMRSVEMEVKFSKKHRIKQSTEPKINLSEFSTLSEKEELMASSNLNFQHVDGRTRRSKQSEPLSDVSVTPKKRGRKKLSEIKSLEVK